jgi:hypothetical protein
MRAAQVAITHRRIGSCRIPPYGKSILQIAARAIALNLLGREDNPLGEWPIRWPDRTPAAEATFMNQGWVSSPPIAPSVRTDNHFRVSA